MYKGGGATIAGAGGASQCILIHFKNCRNTSKMRMKNNGTVEVCRVRLIERERARHRKENERKFYITVYNRF